MCIRDSQSIHSLLTIKKMLMKLHLVIEETSLTSKEFEPIWEKISSLTKLTTFKFVSKENTTLTDIQCSKIILALMHLPSLTSLTLNFANCPEITSRTFSAVTKLLQFQTQITKLKLHFDSADVFDEEILAFGNTLQKLNCLSFLYLSLHGSNISDLAALVLVRYPLSFPKLNSFFLGFRSTRITSECFKNLSEIVENLRRFFKVQLDVRK
eukprot:TRINITY_DN24973_c0_g2_i1.p1 TRINITY_DN24973_c0_g2~~TRINITY_DN24973_c0_g2_i1.p1  ORF type:complete len:230 (+),score=32.86 TRINITY_DN24973_c0_g2_i1:60-692(+)